VAAAVSGGAIGSRIAQYPGVLKFPTAWLLTAIGLAAALAIDDWLSHTPYSRLVLIAGAALMISALINRSNQRRQQPDSPPLPTPALPTESSHLEVPPSELALAIEHIQSIRVLLDVSASHNQPIPRAVLVNLDLVLKHLRKMNGASPSAWDERATVADSAPALAVES
jgi:hypothetical protein